LLGAGLAGCAIAFASSARPASAHVVAGDRATAQSAPAAQRTVRLLLLLPDGEAGDGASMGIAEAQRAAALLGNTIQATTRRVANGATASGAAAPLLRAGHYDAIIGGDSSSECRAMATLARDARAVYVNAWCDDDALRTATAPRCEGSHAMLPALHVAPSQAMRQAAISASTSTAAGTAGAGSDRDHAAPARKAVAWHPSLERYGAAQVNDRYRLAYKRSMTERAWLGWAAVKLVTEIALRPGSGNLGTAMLEPRPLDGHKGRALRIRSRDGQLLQPLYVIAAGTDSTSAASVIAEIANPAGRDTSSAPSRGVHGARCE
jgi:ABC-type branched-subunit amino acid transport system substrate-binding protein